jgi:hypothetical protein
MANVKMYFRDLDEYELPDVCMQCGAPAEGRKNKMYSWFHPALWLLIFAGLIGWIILAVLSSILTKRRKVARPLCPAHINQWPWRTITVLGGFVLFLLAGFAAFVVILQEQDPGRRSSQLGGWLCIGSLGVLLLWLIVAAVIQATSIHPTLINEEAITLTNVSKAFALAYKDEMERDYGSRMDDVVRENWRDEDRKRRPPPSRPPSDAYEPE